MDNNQHQIHLVLSVVRKDKERNKQGENGRCKNWGDGKKLTK